MVNSDIIFLGFARPDWQAEAGRCCQPVRCLLPNLWTQYFENGQTNSDANRHKWSKVRY